MDTKEQRTILTEDQYVLMNGGDDIIGMSIFIQSNLERNDNATEYLNKKMGEVIKKNHQLRQEYMEKLQRGEIRKPTIVEELVMSARCMDSKESTQAARRCCSKRGINWETYNLPEELNNDNI